MGHGDNCFDEAEATGNALHAESSEAELREIATLAYRALEDAYRVISTIDGDDTHEQWELDLLAKRVKDAASSLFVVLRHPKVGADDTAESLALASTELRKPARQVFRS